MRKSILMILVAVMFLMAGAGCVKRVETMDHDKMVVIPEKAVPAKDAAVAAEIKVVEMENEIDANEAKLVESKENLQKANENKAEPEKYDLVKDSQGKLW